MVDGGLFATDCIMTAGIRTVATGGSDVQSAIAGGVFCVVVEIAIMIRYMQKTLRSLADATSQEERRLLQRELVVKLANLQGDLVLEYFVPAAAVGTQLLLGGQPAMASHFVPKGSYLDSWSSIVMVLLSQYICEAFGDVAVLGLLRSYGVDILGYWRRIQFRDVVVKLLSAAQLVLILVWLSIDRTSLIVHR